MLTFEAPLYRLKLKDHRVAFSDRLPVKPKEKPSAAARSLALGYRVMRAIRTGEVRDTAEAARRMGVTQERVAALVGLTFLAPAIQERVMLSLGRERGWTVRRLIQVARTSRWEDQREQLKGSWEAGEGLGQKLSDTEVMGENLAPNALVRGEKGRHERREWG